MTRTPPPRMSTARPSLVYPGLVCPGPVCPRPVCPSPVRQSPARPLSALAVALAVAFAGAPVAAQPAPPHEGGAALAQGQIDPQIDPQADPWATSFRPLPFHRMAEAVGARYAGRLVAAETRPPHPSERALGVELVYAFRLLTPERNLLDIRLDARTGRFLDVSGRGQIEARRAAPGD